MRMTRQRLAVTFLISRVCHELIVKVGYVSAIILIICIVNLCICVGVCESAKPGVERACQIVQTFRYVDEESTNTGTWDVDDEWRQDVLDLIESIYITAVTPGIDVDLIKGVSRVVKAYFTNTIQG